MSEPFLSAALFAEDGDTLVSNLPTAYNRTWLDERDGEGSFSLEVPFEDSAELRPGRIVKFSYGETSTSWRWAGVIESVVLNKTGATAGGDDRVAQVNGRGVRALLENAVVYPSGSSTTRNFNNWTPGRIMRTLLLEAQARGAATMLTAGFTNTNDSNGAPFAKTLDLSESVGSTLAEIADRHAELAVDVFVDPYLVLNYVNSRGSDLTLSQPPVVFRSGQNVSELSTEKGGPVRNTVLVGYGSDKFVTHQDASSVGTYGRNETYLNLQSTSSSSQAQLAAQQVLAASAVPSDGITVNIQPTDAQPYIDWNVGDYVWVIDHTGAQTKFRVQSISITEDDGGNVTVVPELGTLRADLTRRLNRALKRLESGQAGGTTTTGSLTGTTTGGGTSPQIIVLPDGLIEAGVVNGPGGYPLVTTNFAPTGTTISTGPWDVADLRSIGFFQRTFVGRMTSGATTGTGFLDLDDLNHLIVYDPDPPTGAPSWTFFGASGAYYMLTNTSLQKWTGTSWQLIIGGLTMDHFRDGTKWYLVQGPSTGGSFFVFDTATEVLTNLGTIATRTGMGVNAQVVWAVAGYGRAYVRVDSGATRRIYYFDLTAPTVWSFIPGLSGDILAPVTVLDDQRLFWLDMNPTAIPIGCIGRAVDTAGVVEVRAGVYPLWQETVDAGSINQNPSVSILDGTAISAPNGFTLLVTQWKDGPSGPTPDEKWWRIDAVNNYGYNTIVDRTPFANQSGSSGASTYFAWKAGQEGTVLRGSIMHSNSTVQEFLEYNITVTLP